MNVRHIPLVASDVIWFTRGPVPTTSSIAVARGWLAQAFSAHGFQVKGLEETRDPDLRAQHFYHDLKTLVREGGNVFPLCNRAHNLAQKGYDDTVVVGLSWIDEVQVLLARRGAGVRGGDLSSLRGKTFGVSQNSGAIDVWRAMALRGFETALGLGGIGFDDVVLKDVSAPDLRFSGSDGRPDNGSGVTEAALLRGEVDVIYARGGAAIRLFESHDLEIVLDINSLDDPGLRTNNGTPRPVTVHRHLLEDRPDLVKLFLQVLNYAARWAQDNPKEVVAILSDVTGVPADRVRRGYGPRLSSSFDIKLNMARIKALQDQADFLHRHGMIEGRVAVDDWIDTGPLLAAAAEPLIFE